MTDAPRAPERICILIPLSVSCTQRPVCSNWCAVQTSHHGVMGKGGAQTMAHGCGCAVVLERGVCAETGECRAKSGCGYNDFQRLDEQVKAGWSEVLNQYQRRADLIPNIVATVKGEANFEQETLTKVIEARAKATSRSRPRPSWSTTPRRSTSSRPRRAS
jgi:hypothetical protein